MKPLTLLAILALTAATAFVPACSTTSGTSATSATAITTQVENTVETVVSAALPIAAQLGSADAQAYVAGLVSDGTLNQAEATAINAAIAMVAQQIASSTGKAVDAPTQRAAKAAWLSADTRAQVIRTALANLQKSLR